MLNTLPIVYHRGYCLSSGKVTKDQDVPPFPLCATCTALTASPTAPPTPLPPHHYPAAVFHVKHWTLHHFNAVKCLGVCCNRIACH